MEASLPPLKGGGGVVYTRSALDVLFYEDLELGGQWTTRGRTVTDADIAAHAGVSGDFGPLHMDAMRAAAGQFGGRVAHGSLLIAIALGLGSMDVPSLAQVALVGTNWRFGKPVRPGMTVQATWRLGRKRDVTNPRWGLTVWQIELHDQTQERVMEGEVTILVNRREAAAPVSRGRRRRRGKALPPAPVPTAEANLPEPAPADTPAPGARKRRQPRTAAKATVEVPAPEVAAEPLGATPEIAGPVPSSRRRRRRRGGGGGAAGQLPATEGNAAGIAQPPPPPPEPPRGTWAAPEASQPPPAADRSAVSRVFGRFRRSRARPAAPSAEGTRSPSE